jgi:sugar phosphate isomerase/epimerase
MSWFPVRLIESVAACATRLVSVLETGQGFGFRYLELHHSWLQAVTAEDLRDRDLMVSQVSSAPDLADPDPKHRRAELDALRRTLDQAVALGTPTVRVTAGWVRPQVPPDEALKVAAEGLRTVAAEASRVGMTACLENHLHDRLWPRDAVDITADPATFLALCEALAGSGIRVNFDSGQPIAVGADELELLDRVVTQVRSVHVGDRRRGERAHCVIGEGDVRIGAVLARLRNADYSGFVALEDGSPEGDVGLARSVAFMRGCIADCWGQVA